MNVPNQKRPDVRTEVAISKKTQPSMLKMIMFGCCAIGLVAIAAFGGDAIGRWRKASKAKDDAAMKKARTISIVCIVSFIVFLIVLGIWFSILIAPAKVKPTPPIARFY